MCDLFDQSNIFVASENNELPHKINTHDLRNMVREAINIFKQSHASNNKIIGRSGVVIKYDTHVALYEWEDDLIIEVISLPEGNTVMYTTYNKDTKLFTRSTNDTYVMDLLLEFVQSTYLLDN